MKTSTTGSKKILLSLIVAAAWILVWQLIYMDVGKDILVPSPLLVITRITELVPSKEFWVTVGTSFWRTAVGYLLGVGAGVIIALLTSVSKLLRAFFKPVMDIIKATPIASFIILALVILSSSSLSPFCVFLIVVPMVWSNVEEGVLNTDRSLLEMSSLFKMPFLKKVNYIYIPSVKPYFIAACETGVGFAWKAGIAAEVLGQPRDSIGRQLYQAKIYLETTDVFAWTAVVIILSMIIEKIISMLIRRRKSRIADWRHGMAKKRFDKAA